MKNRLLIFTFVLSFLLVSCQETTPPSGGGSSTTTTQGGGSGTLWGDGGSTTGSSTGTSTGTSDGNADGTGTSTGGGSGITLGSGSTCYGTTADGDNSGQGSIGNYNLNLAGGVDMVPTPAGSAGMIPVNYFNDLAFTSDVRLRFRVKIEPQPTSCPYKQSGPASYPYYTKLRFTLKFHTKNTSGGLNSHFHQITDIGPVDVGSCSEIYTMDIPGLPGSFPNPQTSGPIYVSVHDVKTDWECEIQKAQGLQPTDYEWSWYCPAEQEARAQSCWRMTLQVVNDLSDDFK
jgi:hypothetical protein